MIILILGGSGFVRPSSLQRQCMRNGNMTIHRIAYRSFGRLSSSENAIGATGMLCPSHPLLNRDLNHAKIVLEHGKAMNRADVLKQACAAVMEDPLPPSHTAISSSSSRRGESSGDQP